MDAISKFISVSLFVIFAENIVFVHALGTSVVLEAVRSLKTYFKMFSVLTVISMAASGASYFVDKYILAKINSVIILPIIYVIILSLVYIAALLILHTFMPKLFLSIKKFIHLSAFNCAIFGSMFINTNSGGALSSYIGCGFGTGIALMLATALVYIGYKKIDLIKVPSSFEGIPIMLIYIGILSMVFYAITI